MKEIQKQSPVKFGIIGTNFISDRIIEAGHEDPRFEAIAIYSRTQESADAFARKHGIPHTFTRLEDMLAGNLIDAVYVASPNFLHAEHTLLCLSHGKHVLCEKAFAASFPEAESMVREARNRNLVLMEAMKPTLTPNFIQVIRNLNRIGQVRSYFSCFCQYSSRYDRFKAGEVLNAFTPGMSVGALMDIGVYTIYPMVVLFGRPKQIKASGFLLHNGVDGAGTVQFTYDDLLATVMYSKIADSSLPTEIQGEEGTITLDRINIISDVCLHNRREKTIENLTQPAIHHEYYYEIADFIDQIQSGTLESPANTHQNTLVTMEILDEVRRQVGNK